MSGEQKILIITGGSSGIGLATASLFLSRGYKVYELSRHGQTQAGICHIDCDVTQPTLCQNAFLQIWQIEHRIDTVVCNAGMGISGSVEFTSSEEAHRQFDVNYFGALHTAQAALPYLRQQRSGHIIFVSSVMAVFSIPYQSVYASTKAAINMLAAALRNEVRNFGIQVSCIMPGDVKTGFTQMRIKQQLGTDIYTRMQSSVAKMEQDEQNGMSPNCVARIIYRHATCKHPLLFTTVGFGYQLLVWIQRFLPATIVNKAVYLLY